MLLERVHRNGNGNCFNFLQMFRLLQIWKSSQTIISSPPTTVIFNRIWNLTYETLTVVVAFPHMICKSRDGYFIGHMNSNLNSTWIETETRTVVAKYPNRYWIERYWISEHERIIFTWFIIHLKCMLSFLFYSLTKVVLKFSKQ